MSSAVRAAGMAYTVPELTPALSNIVLIESFTVQIEVHIMSGAGNLFSVIDNRDGSLPLTRAAALAPRLCAASEHYQQATEGLILIGAGDSKLDFVMVFFNPDGSYGAMCGNGGRCAVRFAQSLGILQHAAGRRISFSVLGAPYQAELGEATVRLFLPAPKTVAPHRSIELDGQQLRVGYVDVDSDHAVIDFRDLAGRIGIDFASFDIEHWGSQIRRHPAFAPAGVNADFFQLQADGSLALRTFERGVEAETGACGTGAVATALIAAHTVELTLPLRIIPSSGSPLLVDCLPDFRHPEYCTLEGAAEIIGHLRFELQAEAAPLSP